MNGLNHMKNKKELIELKTLSELISKSNKKLEKYIADHKIQIIKKDHAHLVELKDFADFEPIAKMIHSKWEQFEQIKPNREYKSIELFAGAGGMSLGMKQAGFKAILLNDSNKNACLTLKENVPDWNVICEDIYNIDFKSYKNKNIDLLTGGFPCQSFSYIGKRLGFEDTRGTLFFEMARAINEIKPKIVLAENVAGLLTHDAGKTIETIKDIINEIGYTIIMLKLHNTMLYKVPQKRERIIFIAVRNDLYNDEIKISNLPYYHRIPVVGDILKKSDLYKKQLPSSNKPSYSTNKEYIMNLIPQGGNWKNLPKDLQRTYMGKASESSGGKTGFARRLSIYEPSLTLTTAPSQKQTERCHPLETRPLSIREYARIQTFPDNWLFKGSIAEQYKQIGNAVPVNFAYMIGLVIVDYLNKLELK